MLRFILVFAITIASTFCYSQTVTNLNGTYRNGQVFITWSNVTSSAYYKVYRSVTPITDASSLTSCEYLGNTDKHSAENHSLSDHDGITSYLHIDSNTIPLTAGTGLFVSTTLLNGNYFYAITTLLNGIENQLIVTGINSLLLSITEHVSTPLPVFQENRLIAGQSVDIYTTFFSTKRVIGQPLESAAGCIAIAFALNGNHSSSILNPLKVLFHGGSQDFLWKMEVNAGNEINLGLEERLPSGEDNLWMGANEYYDIFKKNSSNTIPTSGIVYNIEEEFISQTIDWAIKYLRIDSNRIYLNGSSMGAGGAFFYAITYPEKIAAVNISVPCFNYAFQNDYNPLNSLNTGQKNRNDGNVEFGTVSSNPMSNLGIHFYDAVNGGWMIHTYREKDYPVIFAKNGKHDAMVGWTEKPMFYDSVKANHLGGYFFWDERDHGGANSTWGDASFNILRYRRDQSYPAFANCSNDEDYGIGNDVTGEAFGTLNGSLDWKDNSMVDSVDEWSIKIFVRDLETTAGQPVVYPDSCTADVTPRRLQKFQVPAGEIINWTITHQNKIVQSGTQVYNGGLIVIPAVKVYKDSCVLKLSYNAGPRSYFLDKDGDGYGNPLKIVVSITQPSGYVENNGDCKDGNAAINPAVTDICNGIDDNCNGITDENAITATITPSGNISICNGTTLIFTGNTVTGISFQWYKNSSVITGATNQTYSAKKTANYYLNYANTLGCIANSPTAIVTFLDTPSVSITAIGNLNICQSGFVDLNANSGVGLTYQWKKGTDIIPGITGQTYTATAKGNYKVVVTNSNGCSKTSKVINVTKSCKESAAFQDNLRYELNCYPNPSNGQFTIDLKMIQPFPDTAGIEIVNLLNQRIYVEKVLIENGELKKGIDISGLTGGVYLLKIAVGESIFSKPLMIQ